MASLLAELIRCGATAELETSPVIEAPACSCGWRWRVALLKRLLVAKLGQLTSALHGAYRPRVFSGVFCHRDNSRINSAAGEICNDARARAGWRLRLLMYGAGDTPEPGNDNHAKSLAGVSFLPLLNDNGNTKPPTSKKSQAARRQLRQPWREGAAGW